ncbi:MAG: class I SAM-dependent methyltransferase [Deltaproteobacteria bacterium]|nr:MAG: class I SAM-dependent methyltransferase [Deltaproteobacteria bacterium]TMQ24264.1 MAG: class I SAM-dependent methyltransferase [Deltaproteobacteria bacterium]
MEQVDEARRVSFDARAELYDAARPSYPAALADHVMARCGRRMLEIGAGTGKATTLFARRGASIVAIEPGASLAAVLRRNVAGLDVTIEQTTFEAWPITRSFEVVVSAQAIHWIDPAVRYVKAAAVLAPRGMLAVIRNEQAALEPALRVELDAAYARWGPEESEPPPDDPIGAAREELVGEIDASGLFGPVDVRMYPWTQAYSTARYLDLLDTYSDHATLADELRTPLYDAIAKVIERRGGVVEIPYVSMAFVAQRTP